MVENNTVYIKDLRIIENVKLSDMIIIDNSVLSFAYQLENGIPILPFYDNPDDNELKFLSNYLCNIAKVEDLRVENRKCFRMDYFFQAAKEEIEFYDNCSGKEDSVLNKSSDSYTKETGKDNNGLFSLNLCASKEECSVVLEHPNESSLNNSFSIVEVAGHQSPCAGKEVCESMFYKSKLSFDKRQSSFQEELLHTLDDLKRTFCRMSESKEFKSTN